MGKVIELRLRDGERELKLNWWTPVDTTPRDNASIVRFDDYYNTRVAYGVGYFNEKSSDGRATNRVADENCEKSTRVLATTSKLNEKGKNIPTSIVTTITGARDKERAETWEAVRVKYSHRCI